LTVLLIVAAGVSAHGQVLPFDHWLNLYLKTAAACAGGVELHRAVWPQDRQTAASLATAPVEAHPEVPLPPWAYDLLRAELQHEIAARREVHFAPGVYVYLRVRATPDSAEVPAFTGHPRQKQRLGGINAAECDYAFVEYTGSWLTARFGRFKESWGPGDGNSVWLSAWGPAYDGVLVELRYRRFQFRALTAYLETEVDGPTKGNVHRYLAAHMLTNGNGRNLWLGLGEGMLYAGVDRPLSLAYSNPFMMYQEYGRNARTNELSKNRDNWFLIGWVEWFPVKRLRT
jgi:hypothetical protein